MCEPISLSTGIALAIAAAIAIASATTTAVMQQQQAKARAKLAKQNAALKRDQIATKQALGAEVSGQKMFELAKAAQLAKGAAESQGLADRSVAAIGRSIGFELGQDKATLQKNQDIASLEAGSQLRGVQLDLDSQLLQIGDTSGLKMGLSIGFSVLQAGGTAIAGGIGGGLGATTSAASAATAAQLIPTPSISSGGSSAAFASR